MPPDGWVEVPVIRGGRRAGLFLVKDNEIHCMRNAEYVGKWLTRQDLQRLTKPLFEAYGCIVTKIVNSNEIGKKFVTRLGFYEVSKDATNTHYRAERLNHARL